MTASIRHWPGTRTLLAQDTTVATDLDVCVGQRQATFRFDLTNGVTGENLGELHPIRTASLSHDTSSTTKRRLSLALGKADFAAINPLTDRVTPFMLFPGFDPFPLGRYMFTSPQAQLFAVQQRIGSVELSDEMFLVDQAITRGVNGVEFSITAVIATTLAPLPVVFDIEPTPFTSAQSWGIGAGRGQILEALAFTGDYWCMAPETRILDAEMRWRPLGDLIPGDEIVGFDENVRGSSQRYRRAIVESTNRRVLDCFEIETEFGTTVASAEHLWLVKRPIPTSGGHNRDWKRTADLVPGDRIVAFGAPWQDDMSWGGGYLAGLFDGEGSLAIPGGRGAHTSKVPRLSYGQKPGLVLDQARRLLAERGFSFRDHKHPTSGVINPIQRGGKYEAMRLLGSLRPARLLAKSSFLWEGRCTWSVERSHRNQMPVLSVRSVGPREVVAVGTSTRTLIADGLLTHNSPWFGNDTKLHFERTFDAAVAVPDFDFDLGAKVHRASIVETTEVLTAPNVFIVISNGGRDSAIGGEIVGIATVPPSAPHSVANRGFEIPQQVDVQLSDQAQAQAVALGLAQRQNIFDQTSLTTALDPRHDSYDVIRWQGANWLELAWSMQMVEGGDMTHVLRKSHAA